MFIGRDREKAEELYKKISYNWINRLFGIKVCLTAGSRSSCKLGLCCLMLVWSKKLRLNWWVQVQR